MSNPWSIWSKVPGYRIQTATIDQSLHMAGTFIRAARVVRRDSLRERLKGIGRAYLNRACELACVPLDLYPVETAQGVEMVWHTYRPIADFESGRSFHLPVVVGYENSMSETEARSRAIGW